MSKFEIVEIGNCAVCRQDMTYCLNMSVCEFEEIGTRMPYQASNRRAIGTICIIDEILHSRAERIELIHRHARRSGIYVFRLTAGDQEIVDRDELVIGQTMLSLRDEISRSFRRADKKLRRDDKNT